MSTRRKWLLGLAALIAVTLVAGPRITGVIVDHVLDQVEPPNYLPTERARLFHRKLRVADLHADSLLTSRDLAERSSRGHADLARLRDGGVVIQGLGIVTKVPRENRMDHNDDQHDAITTLAIATAWPIRTWSSLIERALYQAGRAQALEAHEHGRFRILRTTADVKQLLADHAKDPGVLGAVLGLEGAHALEGDLANVDRLYDAGVRTVGLAHFFDNEWAGSAHGEKKYGLTAKGRALIAKLDDRRMTIDLAHSSPATIRDVLASTKRPVIVSHTGVAATCPGPRNLTDEQLRAIAAHGGIIGIGYWNVAVCSTDPAAIARAISHAISVAGVDHVALGSDFDGAVTTPFDASGLDYVTDALLSAGLDRETIEKVMGENAIAFYARALP